MSEPKGTAVGEQDSVAARLMLLMKVRRRSPAAAMQPLQRRHRAYRARYRQHHPAGDAHRVGRVERVQPCSAEPTRTWRSAAAISQPLVG